MSRQPDDKLPGDGGNHVTGDQAKDPESGPTPESIPVRPREIGGRPVPEPTRFGDWEKDGRCVDF
jgi:hypothetical protein